MLNFQTRGERTSLNKGRIIFQITQFGGRRVLLLNIYQ